MASFNNRSIVEPQLSRPYGAIIISEHSYNNNYADFSYPTVLIINRYIIIIIIVIIIFYYYC